MPTAPPAVDEGTFVQWVRPSLLAMTRLAARLVPGDDVDDVVQEAVERAWRTRGRYDPERGTPTTWLLAITASAAHDARRRTWRRQRLADAAPPDRPDVGANHDVDLDRAIDALPRRQRLAVHCFYFLDLPVADTAQVMGCSVGTVKSALHDARKALRHTLGDDS